VRDRIVRRVLMTGDTVGGVWTYVLELCEGLAAHGVQVMLATMGGDPSAEQEAAASAIPNVSLLGSRYKLEWMDDPWADVEASGAWLLDLERQFAPDVIHLNTLVHGHLPFEAPVLVTVHSCVLSWWASVKGGSIPASWSRYRNEVETSLKAVDTITAPSHAMLRTVRLNYGIDSARCRVIPNGRAKARYRVGAKEDFALAAGRLWDEGKNISAVARVAGGLPWPVYLAGEQRSPNGTSVELPGCRMLGQLSPQSLADWYRRAAIYALPARYEPFGLSALEAALSGCALVLGDIESLREIWRDAAIFVPPDDAEQLAAALRVLMANRPLRKEMARRSLSRALTFTPERMALGYLEAYSELAGRRRVSCAS
jgi:glycogen(starch) synthase